MSIYREHLVKRFLRDPKWYKLRKLLIHDHPYCSVCGGEKGLEGHHIIPVSIAPKLELSLGNCIVLCRPKRCHQRFGHFDNWKHYNPYILYDAYKWFQLITGEKDTLSPIYEYDNIHKKTTR
jgi:hypothetical protein